MADRIITATELARTLSDTLIRVQYRGERFTIERNGDPVASLVPAKAPGLITLSELAAQLWDLTLPGDGFADDLEAIQAAQDLPPSPQWSS